MPQFEDQEHIEIDGIVFSIDHEGDLEIDAPRGNAPNWIKKQYLPDLIAWLQKVTPAPRLVVESPDADGAIHGA